MSSERLPGEAGIIQNVVQTEMPTADIVTYQQNAATESLIGSGIEIFDKLRRKWIAAGMAVLTGLVLAESPSFEEPAHAANIKHALIGMPFEGKWAYVNKVTPPYSDSNSSHPSVHNSYSFQWATDLYAGADTEVKVYGSSPQGDVTFKRRSTSDSCASYGSGIAGSGVTFDVLVEGSKIGEVKYDHLDLVDVGNEPVASGTKIGEITSEPLHPSCYQVAHAHIQLKNTVSDESCYVDHGDTGKTLTAGTNVGVVGSNNAVAKEACGELPTTRPPDPLNLSFVRLNDARGNAWVDSYSEASGFQGLVENTNTNYPVVSADGRVVPIFQPDGDLSFVNLSYPGHAQVVTYSEASGYKQVIENIVTAYPSVLGDGSVIPMYQFDGDLSFIRLNHPQGTEVIAYSQASGYQELVQRDYALYPPVETDGSVVPMYWLNDDLIMLRLNHYSGRVEMYAYGKSSGYRQTVNQAWLPYPALSAPGTAPGKNVIPLLHPQRGEISFVRLNHSSGRAEVITYGGAGFQQTTFQGLAGYPAVPGDGNVIPRYSN